MLLELDISKLGHVTGGENPSGDNSSGFGGDSVQVASLGWSDFGSVVGGVIGSEYGKLGGVAGYYAGGYGFGLLSDIVSGMYKGVDLPDDTLAMVDGMQQADDNAASAYNGNSFGNDIGDPATGGGESEGEGEGEGEA